MEKGQHSEGSESAAQERENDAPENPEFPGTIDTRGFQQFVWDRVNHILSYQEDTKAHDQIAQQQSPSGVEDAERLAWK